MPSFLTVFLENKMRSRRSNGSASKRLKNVVRERRLRKRRLGLSNVNALAMLNALSRAGPPSFRWLLVSPVGVIVKQQKKPLLYPAKHPFPKQMVSPPNGFLPLFEVAPPLRMLDHPPLKAIHLAAENVFLHPAIVFLEPLRLETIRREINLLAMLLLFRDLKMRSNLLHCGASHLGMRLLAISHPSRALILLTAPPLLKARHLEMDLLVMPHPEGIVQAP